MVNMTITMKLHRLYSVNYYFSFQFSRGSNTLCILATNFLRGSGLWTLTRLTRIMDRYDTKTHTGTVFVPRELNFWLFELEISLNGFPGFIVEHFYVTFGDASCSGFSDRQTNRQTPEKIQLPRPFKVSKTMVQTDGRTLDQGSQTRGPRAACGPQSNFMRPATTYP